MEKFLVQFPSMFSNLKELWDNERNQTQKESLGLGDNKETFANEKDYIGKFTIDMMAISGFESGLVYINGVETDCVFAQYSKPGMDILFTRNILIRYQEFKRIWEHANNEVIPTSDEILIKHYGDK